MRSYPDPRPNLFTRFCSAIVLPIVLSLTTTIVTSQWMLGPDISGDTARLFFSRYYKDVFDQHRQRHVWDTEQTEGYHRLANHGWTDFDHFYDDVVEHADIQNVYAAGESRTNQFVVTLQFQRVDGTKADPESHIFGLICTDQTARLPFVSCPIDRVQIDAVMPVN